MIANFAVTYRCTSRCKTCSIWKMDQPEQGELSLEEIRVLFSSNRGFLRDVGSIQITGGEPFLRADLPELVSSIREQLSECTFWIPTNGMTPNSIEKATRTTLESLDGHGLGVSVSIDGLGRTHDGVRGIPGSFERAVETLIRLSAVRGDHPGLGLSVGMTLTPDNFRELGDVFNLARSHGAEFSFRPVNYSGIYYRNLGDELSMAGFEGELLPAIRGIGRDAVERHGPWKAAPTLRYMQGVMDHVRNPRGRRLRCSAGSGSLFLDPYGNVYPCIFLDERMGNVREQSLGEIWDSEEASEARVKVRNRECPGCWVECETFRDINRDLKGLASTVLWALLHPETAGIS
jgi:MoaA/NifB/PqqE/SkfB family radical SAM enzyme